MLPACGTLYFALASIWGLPYAEQIIGTISAVTVFIGALIGISTSNYNKSFILEEFKNGKGDEGNE